MRRIAILVALIACSCGRVSPHPSATPRPSPTPRSTIPLGTGGVQPAAALPASNDAWVDVSVATVWTLPTSVRAIDEPALVNAADPRGWLASLTDRQKLDLVGRVQTQVLYGTHVVVIGRNGTWAHIVVPDQRSQKDARGYPGWVPAIQLTSTNPPAGPTMRITSPTLTVRGFELSYGTRLPLVGNDTVQLLDGRRASVPSGDVSSVDATDVVAEAKKFLGLPYMWGGTSGFGFDCSGFTMLVYRSVGISLSRDTDQQVHDGRAVPMSEIRPGDLLFVADSSGAVVHEAIFIGDGRIIESPRTGLGVRIVPLSTHSYVAARRVLPG